MAGSQQAHRVSMQSRKTGAHGCQRGAAIKQQTSDKQMGEMQQITSARVLSLPYVKQAFKL